MENNNIIYELLDELVFCYLINKFNVDNYIEIKNKIKNFKNIKKS